KGHSLSADRILGTAERARPFIAGPVLLVRLAPVDYHHVHYPDHGRTLDQDRLGHRLWTVNWHALVNKPDILFSNERVINILETRHFGRLAFVEVGALSVGRIVQVHPLDKPFQRGEEKSVFRLVDRPSWSSANRARGVPLTTCLSTRSRESRPWCGLANPWGCGRSSHRSDTRPLDRGSERCTSRHSAVVPNFGSDRSEPDIPRALAAYRSGESDPGCSLIPGLGSSSPRTSLPGPGFSPQ